MSGYCEEYMDALHNGLIIEDDVGTFLKFKKQLFPMRFCPFCGRTAVLEGIPYEFHEPTDAQFMWGSTGRTK